MTYNEIINEIIERSANQSYRMFAKIAGVSHGQIQKIFNFTSVATGETLIKLCHAVGLEIVVREKEVDVTETSCLCSFKDINPLCPEHGDGY